MLTNVNIYTIIYVDRKEKYYMDFSTVSISGRLVRDSEMQHKKAENAPDVLRFTVASGYSKKINNEYQDFASFIDVVAFNKRAESLEKFLKKGLQVFLTGTLRIESWQDKNGDYKNRTYIILDNLTFGAAPKNASQEPKPEAKSVEKDDFENFEDDIPF